MNSICLNISAQFESPIALMLIVHERAALEVFATLYLILSKKLQILSAFLPANNKETRPTSCLPRVPPYDHTCSCHGTQLLPYIRGVTVLPGSKFSK